MMPRPVGATTTSTSSGRNSASSDVAYLWRRTSDLDVATEERDRVTGALHAHPTRDADELRDELGRRPRIELGRCGDLLGATARHDADPVGHREGLFLVVGHEDRRDHQALLERSDLIAKFGAHLGVQGRERLVEQEDARFDRQARARATRCC